MSYTPSTDFLALLRSTAGGMRTAQMPGLDYVIAAMARAGMFSLSIGQTPPTSNQDETVWLKPALQSWTAEGAVFLWNAATLEYEPGHHHLWAALWAAAQEEDLQDVTTAGPVDILAHSDIVRVMNVGAPVTLVMPPSSEKVGAVLVSDWANAAGTNNITITLENPADVFPGGVTTWVLAGDGASVFLRPVPGGYAL